MTVELYILQLYKHKKTELHKETDRSYMYVHQCKKCLLLLRMSNEYTKCLDRNSEPRLEFQRITAQQTQFDLSFCPLAPIAQLLNSMHGASHGP
jgi:hypothetical protein